MFPTNRVHSIHTFLSYESEDDFEDWEVTKLMLFVPSGTNRYQGPTEKTKLTQTKGKLTNEIVKMINDGLFVYEQVNKVNKQTNKQFMNSLFRIATSQMRVKWYFTLFVVKCCVYMHVFTPSSRTYLLRLRKLDWLILWNSTYRNS